MYAFLAVVAVLALWWLSRQSEMFCLSVRDGKTVVVRGRIVTGLRTDIADVMRSREVRRGTIKGYRGEHGGSLSFAGEIDESTQQRLRNIFALYPASSLRKAPAIAKPTLGQLLGIAWLAHFFDARS